MSTKLFVGNLDYSMAEDQLRTMFQEFGQVISATVISDRMTGQSRGFGFVEYQSAEDAQKAISSLDGTTMNGRAINVNVARERSNDRSGGGGGGGGGFGGGGRSGGGGGGGGGRGGSGRRQDGGDRW